MKIQVAPALGTCGPWSLQESDKDRLQKLQKGEAVPEDGLDGPRV